MTLHKSLFFTLPLMLAPPLMGQTILKSLSTGGAQYDLQSDGLFSSDIKIINSSFQFRVPTSSPGLTLTGSYGRTDHDIDYSPAPGTFTSDNNRRHTTDAYSLGLEKTLRPNLIGGLTASYSKGFSDHRSIWIDEFYQQSFQGFSSFGDANPQSYSVSTSLQWDYAPNRGSLLATAGFSNALIVAGVGIDPDTVINPLSQPDVLVGEEGISTFTASLQWTEALNSRLRVQQTFNFTEVENRRSRFQLQSELAYYLGKNWTMRLEAGAAYEEPTFEAYYGGITMVYEWNKDLQFDFGFRYYEDTGEISNTNFNTAAPGTENTEASVGVLWRRGKLSTRASVALYITDFDPVQNNANLVFANLYRDRDFVAARLAFSYDF